MKRIMLITAALVASFTATSALASAPIWLQTDRAPIASPAPTLDYVQRQITAREAKAIALSRFPGGEVVDIRRTGDAYRVRVIARDGRVVDVVVDANTGRIR